MRMEITIFVKSIPGISEAFPNRSEYIEMIIKAHAKPRELIEARFSIFFGKRMEAIENSFFAVQCIQTEKWLIKSDFP